MYMGCSCTSSAASPPSLHTTGQVPPTPTRHPPTHAATHPRLALRAHLITRKAMPITPALAILRSPPLPPTPIHPSPPTPVPSLPLPASQGPDGTNMHFHGMLNGICID